MNKNGGIKVVEILEYYDMIQLFIGKDIDNNRYVCVLYDDTPVPKYFGVKLTKDRLQSFCKKEVDLRSLYIEPESKDDLYIVTKNVTSVSFDEYGLYSFKDFDEVLTEDMLPREGYYYESKISVLF